MADPIGPITDAYIDGIIKASNAYNPNLNLTQGIQLRALVKLLRDRLEQEISNLEEEILPGLTDIVYADLVTAMTGGTLVAGAFYRITDFQTVHNIPNTSPAVLNTGPIEPLIVLAISSNALGVQAWSSEYPSDYLNYTTDNSRISGATKGCILRRVDTILGNDVCNDFRSVKYRRWKYNPPAFDSTAAYNQYAPVLYTDGGIYFVMKSGGFAAGTASTPSATSDDWAQVSPNNNYYMSNLGTATGNIVWTSDNRNQAYRNVVCPINQNDFVDTVAFPNYGPGFTGNVIDNGPGDLFNMVVWNINQTEIMKNCIFLKYASTSFNSTFVLLAGYVQGMEFRSGLAYILFILNGGYVNRFVADVQCTEATFNVTQMLRVSGQFYYTFVRGRFANVTLGRAEYVIFPNNVRQLYAPFGIGNIKFTSNAEIRGLILLTEFGNEYMAGDINVGATSSEQYVNYPLFWRTVIGSFANAYGVYANLANMLTKVQSRHITYAYEEPAGKSVLTITNGQSLVKQWQSDLTDINLTDMSGSDGYPLEPSTFKYMTYYTKHGNDFQVQQKDLINGAWVPHYPPSYSIDAVDTNGNITQVTLNPNISAGVTSSVFIIV